MGRGRSRADRNSDVWNFAPAPPPGSTNYVGPNHIWLASSTLPTCFIIHYKLHAFHMVEAIPIAGASQRSLTPIKITSGTSLQEIPGHHEKLEGRAAQRPRSFANEIPVSMINF